MLHYSFYQHSLFEVDPDAIGLEGDAFERHLPWLISRLVSPGDFKGFYIEDQGAGTCCPMMLLAMLLLQFRFDVSDKELVRRCRRDLGWRYATQSGFERDLHHSGHPGRGRHLRIRPALDPGQRRCGQSGPPRPESPRQRAEDERQTD